MNNKEQTEKSTDTTKSFFFRILRADMYVCVCIRKQEVTLLENFRGKAQVTKNLVAQGPFRKSDNCDRRGTKRREPIRKEEETHLCHFSTEPLARDATNFERAQI